MRANEPRLFRRDHAWHGGFFELLFQLPNADSPLAESALQALWASPYLEGCYLRNDVEPTDQPEVSPTANLGGHIYGVATLPNEKKSACGSLWNFYPALGSRLTFYLPMGSLQGAYPVGSYPIKSPKTPPPEVWLGELNIWLKGIAEGVFHQVPFDIAVIGFEPDYPDLTTLLRNRLPDERWDGFLIKRDAGLVWYPPTILDPPMGFGSR
jgi:hypothetical protein